MAGRPAFPPTRQEANTQPPSQATPSGTWPCACLSTWSPRARRTRGTPHTSLLPVCPFFLDCLKESQGQMGKPRRKKCPLLFSI